MPLFENAFALQIPVRVDRLHLSFFINQNLYTTSSEAKSVPHNHHDIELRFVCTGFCTQFIDGKKYIVDAGKCLIIHPFEYHWQSWDSKNPDSTQYNLRFSLKKTTNSHITDEANRSFAALLDSLRIVKMDPDRIIPLFQVLTNEIYQKRPGFIHYIQSICTQIIIELLRYSGADLNFFHFEETKYLNYERTKIDQFFQQQFLKSTSIKDLAEQMHVSVRQINYLMHRMYNMSFVEKLTEMRLQLSLTQLAYTNDSIAEVAHACAFQNQNYFSKCFHRFFGKTPSEYRKQMQKSNSLPRTAERK